MITIGDCLIYCFACFIIGRVTGWTKATNGKILYIGYDKEKLKDAYFGILLRNNKQ
jgi:hypothetical protein